MPISAPSSDPTPRRRNAAATREAILASARRAFAQHGYDGVGVRDIAAGAGVTAMMVNRYFGSKDGLFAAVAEATTASPTILSRENLNNPQIAEAFARALVDITRVDDTPLEGFLILLHSASSKRAAEIGRHAIEQGHLKTLTEALDGDLAPQRAALFLSLVAGFQLMRQALGLSALADASPADLVKLITPVFQQLIRADGANGD